MPTWRALFLVSVFAAALTAQQSGPNAASQKLVNINDIIANSPVTASGASAATGVTGPTVTLGLANPLALPGNLALPNSTSSAVGVIQFGGNSFLHNFGQFDTFLGQSAGNFTTTGGANTAVGYSALPAVTTGSGNTAIGSAALLQATIGGGNTAVGAGTLTNYTGDFGILGTVHNNTAIGSSALNANTGGGNTAVGALALTGNTTGLRNAALGRSAGAATGGGNTTGSGNTFLGDSTGFTDTTQRSNATAIGANAVVGADNSLVLGAINGVNNGVGVNVGIGTATPGRALDVVGDIRASGCVIAGATTLGGTCVSDVRLKKDIQAFSPVLNRLVQLRPVSYSWRVQEFPEYHFPAGRSFGLVAQEVEKVFPEMVSIDKRGFKQVNYGELPYLMLQAVRELKTERDSLADAVQQEIQQRDEQIAQLKRQVKRQEAEMFEVRAEMATLRAAFEKAGGPSRASAALQ